ncbi:GH25 family lysozyme [Hydrogenibacillus sp. N12]|uniref:glycoside hydrolase family 25 protein n=1 Tax=Hydrogenibacillus sp. N12 TaxID=2866627 RepID=UPI001C7CC093|nr:GH25 family lysozyme [Hydrogenibacillus sp. N12]QZA33040.1 glycoside hydrolase family 25 protein [Hydrogenibacillus sp. N12]
MTFLRYQGQIDWEAVRKSGRRFAFIKATEGTTWVDPRLSANGRGADRAGLAVGYYHFFRAADPKTALEEAEAFWRAIRGLPFVLPPALDLEVVPSGTSPQALSRAVLAGLQAIEPRIEARPLLYSSLYFLQNRLEGR